MQLGDIVKVIEPQKVYSRYIQCAEKYGLTFWKKLTRPDTQSEYQITHWNVHEDWEGVCIITSLHSGQQYIIAEDGLEAIGDWQPTIGNNYIVFHPDLREVGITEEQAGGVNSEMPSCKGEIVKIAAVFKSYNDRLCATGGTWFWDIHCFLPLPNVEFAPAVKSKYDKIIKKIRAMDKKRKELGYAY